MYVCMTDKSLDLACGFLQSSKEIFFVNANIVFDQADMFYNF